MAFEPPERMLAFLRSPAEAEDGERDDFWTLFYRMFRSHYERMAMHDYGLNQEDAEDIVLVTMARVDVIMRLPMTSFPSLAKFLAFFRLKLKQTILDLKKIQKRVNEILAQVRQTGGQAMPIPDVEQVPDSSETDTTLSEAMGEAIVKCKENLDEEERKVFEARVERGRTWKEVAADLGLPEWKVKRILTRAMCKMRDCLSDRGWTPT